MSNIRSRTTTFEAIIMIILIIGVLRFTRAVTMPLAVALVIVALAWPLHRRLEQRLPRALSLALTFLVIMLLLALFVWIIIACMDMVSSRLPDYRQQLEALARDFSSWINRLHLPFKLEHIDTRQVLDRGLSAVSAVAVGVYGVVGLFVLVMVFFLFSLLEVDSFRAKLQKRFDSPKAREILAATEDVVESIQRFMLTRTLTSALTGLLIALYTWMMGLDFPLVWGLIAFLLNYIPVLGSVVAVIPPTLVALIKPHGLWLAPATLAGLTVIQMTIGNYLDPQLQGRFLSLSPLVLFFSVVFWGWVWGIPGAFISTPITVSLIIFARHFSSTKWVADILSNRTEDTR